MSDESPNLALPYIMPGQAQKHVTHNEAIRLLDCLVQLAVLNRTLTAPPGSPSDGDRHLVAAGATGAWAGWDQSVACRVDGVWTRLQPQPGWRVWVVGEGLLLVWSGSAWVSSVTAFDLQNLAGVGIGATSDATNRLSVASEAILLNHAGAGHQVKVNKAAAANTASLLYQTGFSGRAEIGTTGNDDLSVKVSADGSTWRTPLVVAAATGLVSLAHGLSVTGLLTGTAVTQSATDTTAGRLLKVGDHGLGLLNPRAGGVTLPDWLSTSQPTGFHHMGNDSETLNKPAGISGAGWGSALTVRTSDVIGARIGWRGFRNSAEFFMQKWDSGGMGWLLKFFNNRNIVGTVVDAAGVPDGAIIETGSNANGRYTRFADGTQICWRTMAAASGAAATWTFPAAFAAAPAVTGTAVATVLSAVCLDAAPTTTAATFSARDKADARRADTCHLRAEGRWF